MFDFDERPPNDHVLIHAQPTPQTAQTVSTDWKWLERHIPYDGSCEGGLHWFFRFKA